MPIPGHFETVPAGPGRPRESRRRLQLEAEGALASGHAARVMIHNVSASGLLIETPVPLAEGERIDIVLPQLGPTPARVVWNSGALFGCRFDQPLPQAGLSALQLRAETEAPPPPATTSAGETLPVRIARLRKQQGLTLDALASLVGVSKPTVWAWEQGKARPTQDRLAALAAQLGVVEEELVTGRRGDALNDALAAARRLVAEAYGVDPGRVRVLIEL